MSVTATSPPAVQHFGNEVRKHPSFIKNGPAAPPDRNEYGQRLLPNVADELAITNPTKVHASIAVSADIRDGFRDITISQMVNAANSMALEIDQLFGKSPSFEVVSYLGISDLRYSIMVIACMKTGYQIMVPSIRNSLSMNLALLRRTNCDKIFYSKEVAHLVEELKAARPSIVSVLMPSFEALIESPYKAYAFHKTFAEAEDQPVLICHTSGSTGDPVPITLTYGGTATWDGARHIPKIQGRRNQDYAMWNFKNGGRFYSSFPPFHLAGLVNNTFLPIWYDTTVVLGPPDRPGTGQLVCEAMRQFTLKGVYCPPSILEQMCQEPGGLEEAKKLDFAIFTGGPLAPATGDALSKVTSLCQIYGSTEIGVTPALVPLPQNWAYLEFHPFYGHVMEEVGEDQYEMVLYRDMTMKRFRQVCHTNPNVEVWRTKDVFKPHPTEPNLWQFQGRIDDIMVLGNGEKFNPVPIEKTVEGHPLVYGALMVGQGKELPALIIEPEKGVALDSKDLLDAIWPIIQEANSRAPGHARVNRSMVLIAKTEKPFLRAGKGTIVRKLSVAAFSDEIEKLYSEENNEVNDVPDLDPPYDQKAIQGFVQAAVKLYFPKIDLDNQSDFFVLGLDSLQTLEFVSRLKAGLRAHPNGRKCSWLSAKIVYAKPTIKALSQEIDERLKLGMESKINSGEEEAERSSRMSVIVDKYTRDILGCTSVSSRHQRDTDLTVVLTGSTGSLGTHLLEALLNDRGISTIYCMNRCRDAQERHEKNFRDRGLESSIFSSQNTTCKVRFLQVEFGTPKFGLEQSLFDELTASVDAIIHNAWKVDFLHNLESFEPVHIRGVRSFIEWSMRSDRRPHIFFVSSISSVGNWPTKYPGRKPVPETPHETYNVASQLGYGESKHVSERILRFATERCGVPTSILRVGQIAGPLKKNGGPWHETEWFPTLVKTSKNLGLIPDTIPDINWIPVDTLATIMLELVHHATKNEVSQVYNIVNPRFAIWAELVSSIQRHFQPRLRTVSFREWLDALKKLDLNDPEETASKPALKILDFYEALALVDGLDPLTYDTRHGQEGSQAMARLPAIRPSWMTTWLQQWNF